MEIPNESEMFFSPEDLENWKGKEINLTANVMNEITDKNNEYLLIGVFGNGSGFLKASFFKEMKASGAFKIKFMTSGTEDTNKKKSLCAELYQVTMSDGKKASILLTKSTTSGKSYELLFKYFADEKILFNNVIVLDSIYFKNFVSFDKVENKCFTLQSSKNTINLGSTPLLPPPNGIGGFSAFALQYCDFKDIPCTVVVSVHNFFDICLESVRVFSGAFEGLIFGGKVSDEYFAKEKIELGQLKSVFNEFNSAKKTYFS